MSKRYWEITIKPNGEIIMEGEGLQGECTQDALYKLMQKMSKITYEERKNEHVEADPVQNLHYVKNI